MASNLLVVASNLRGDGQPTSDGLQPKKPSDGLQPTSDGLQPKKRWSPTYYSDCLQPKKRWPPTYVLLVMASNLRSDGLQLATSDGLQPKK